MSQWDMTKTKNEIVREDVEDARQLRILSVPEMCSEVLGWGEHNHTTRMLRNDEKDVALRSKAAMG